jgi:hypothetical protein
MKRFIFKTGTCLLLLIVFGAGCDKKKTDPDPTEEECNYETTETDPAKLIIGQWELSKVWMGDKEGYKPVDINNPGDIPYLEFRPDSVAKFQSIYNGDLYTTYLKYWVDTLLHYYHPDGYPRTPWFYEFPNNCTLKLDNAFLALSPIGLISKRTEQ